MNWGMNSIGAAWRGLVHLAYPRLCAGCRQPLNAREEVLCLFCYQDLPLFQSHDDTRNEVVLRLAGRIPFAHASAYGLFTRDGLLQHLLHQLKYRGRKEVGRFLGKQAGLSLHRAAWAGAIDGIVPVPLHGKKEAWRGFNQSLELAKGMAEVLQVPVLDRLLLRTRHTESQTNKSREEREVNVRNAFELTQGTKLGTKHLLLIDDVLTTGATLEAAALPILSLGSVRLSIFPIGLAMG